MFRRFKPEPKPPHPSSSHALFSTESFIGTIPRAHPEPSQPPSTLYNLTNLLHLHRHSTIARDHSIDRFKIPSADTKPAIEDKRTTQKQNPRFKVGSKLTAQTPEKTVKAPETRAGDKRCWISHYLLESKVGRPP
ncbi:hypothetical protein Bca101_030723 [Brassica carinata]